MTKAPQEEVVAVATCPVDEDVPKAVKSSYTYVGTEGSGSGWYETTETITERVVEFPDGRRETTRTTCTHRRPVLALGGKDGDCVPSHHHPSASVQGGGDPVRRGDASHNSASADAPALGVVVHSHPPLKVPVAAPTQQKPHQHHGNPPQQQGTRQTLTLINAWYGVDGNGSDNGGQVQAALRRNIAEHGGRLVLNGSHHTLFGFDPLPGVHKVVGIHVRYYGQEHHLRARDGAPFTFPDANNTRRVEQHRPNIEIINAWYGVDGNGSDNGGQVQEHLRRLLREHGHVHIPADQFGLYGFDPVYGVHKVTGLHVRCNGQEHHLRAPEGQDFNWYGN